MITVPKKALCEKGEDGEETYPEVGDTIDLGEVTGKVAAADGDTYSIEVDSVRGMATGAPAKKAADDDGEDEPAEDEADGMGLAGAELPKDKAGLALRRKVAGMDKRKYN